MCSTFNFSASWPRPSKGGAGGANGGDRQFPDPVIFRLFLVNSVLDIMFYHF